MRASTSMRPCRREWAGAPCPSISRDRAGDRVPREQARQPGRGGEEAGRCGHQHRCGRADGNGREHRVRLSREIELVTASLENKPGSLAAAVKKLADAGINIDAAVPTGMGGSTVSVSFARSSW